METDTLFKTVENLYSSSIKTPAEDIETTSVIYLEKAGLDPDKFNFLIGKNGRVLAENKKTHRRTTIGVQDENGEIVITAKMKKAPKSSTRKIVTFHVNPEVFDKLTRKALLQGDTVSSYVRDLVVNSLEE